MLKRHNYLFYTVLGQSMTDICDEYDTLETLPYLAERIINYKLSPEEKPVCDYFLPSKWYRMGEYVLTESNVPCGTDVNYYRLGKTLKLLIEDNHLICIFVK